MKVPLAVLCDAANVSREGKLNILGVFSAVRAVQFPHAHPSMTLVVGLEATYTERGDHAIDIRLVDADGQELLKLDGHAVLQSDRPGHPIFTQAILTLNNLTFPRAGTYTVDILVDRRHERSLPLEVMELATPVPQGSADGGSGGEPQQ